MNTKAMKPFRRSISSLSFIPLSHRPESEMHLFLLLALLLLLQNLLDDLLLLNQESADNAVTDAATASRTTVGTLDGLLGLGDLGVLARAESGDL
jgi:hypothetical protein